MKFALFICLICAFWCEIYKLQQYGKIKDIKDGYGLIVLELDKFDKGDKIYITYSAYDGKLNNIIYYNFEDTFPENETMELKEQLNSYTDSVTTHTRNVTENGVHKTYKTYERSYYYEFEKKTNNKYLVMRYSFSKGEVKRLEVENTRLSNSTLAIVLVSVSVGGFILIAGTILFITRRKNKCCRKTYSSDINFNAKKNKKSSLPPVSPIIPPQPIDVNNNIPMDVNYGQDKPYYVQDNMPNIYPQNNYGGAYNYQNNLNNIPTTNDTTYNSS